MFGDILSKFIVISLSSRVIGNVVDLSGEHIYEAKVKSGGLKVDLVSHDLCPLVACRVYPADEVEVVDVVQSAEVGTPFGRFDGDEAIVWTFFFENDRVWPFPSIDEARFVNGAPRKVAYSRYVRSVLVEFSHAIYSERFKGFSVATTVG